MYLFTNIFNNANFADYMIIAVIVAGIIIFALYTINKKLSVKMGNNQELIERSKQTTSIFVIDKKKSKIKEINLPKSVIDQMPKVYKFLKLHFVQAKIGSQIMTLMCDKRTFNAISIKKNIKVEIAGIYIVSVIGMKSVEELKQIKKAKKDKLKQEKKLNKSKSK